MLTALALVSAGSLLLTGCQGGGESSANIAERESPLDPYFGVLWNEEDWSDERMAKLMQQEEELVAACMHAEGFEYIPVDHSDMISYSSDYEGPEWNTEAFVTEYGFGIAHDPWMQMEEPIEDEEEYVDPNSEYLESLSQSEQDAYYEALYGDEPTEEEWALMEEDETYEWIAEDEGCYGEAQAASNEDADNLEAMWEDPEFENLFEQLELLYTDVERDERVTNLQRDWATCMADKGVVEFTDRDLMQETLYEEWGVITDEYYATLGESDEWGNPSGPAVDAFAEREMELARVDFDCATELKWDQTLIDVTTELEQAFVDENKATLEAMVSKYGVKN